MREFSTTSDDAADDARELNRHLAAMKARVDWVRSLAAVRFELTEKGRNALAAKEEA